MRIRKKRLALLTSIADRRSEAALPPEPSDQTMPAANKTGVLPNDAEKEFGDTETLRSMEKTNEIRKNVTSLDPPLSSVQVVSLKKRGLGVMEGSRCSRVNGRGWRCCQPTLVGYSLCQHHLGKGPPSLRRGGGGAPPEEEEEKPVVVAAKKRSKVGVVKARSMSSLLSQI